MTETKEYKRETLNRLQDQSANCKTQAQKSANDRAFVEIMSAPVSKAKRR